MTIINQKSISGITSITFASAGDDLLTFHSNNGTERFRIDNSGNTKITAGIVTTLTVTGNGTVGGTLSVTGDVDIADKIVHTGDTNTAIRFPAADTVTVETAGTEALRVDSSQKLLIGTTSSQGHASGNLLEIGNYTLTNAGITINNPTNGAGLILFGDSSSTNRRGRIEYTHVSDAFRFYTADSERLRITSDGNIGIGSDIPQKKLDVAGDVKILDNSPRLEFHDANSSSLSNVTGGFEGYDKSGNRAIYVGAGMENGGNIIEFGTNNTFRAIIDSSGNIGIGTASPSSLLHLNANATALRITRGSSIGFLYNSGANSTDPTRLQAESGPLELYTNSAQPIKVIVNGTEEARFLSGGGLTFNGDTAAANALDDYEEGTWTPDFRNRTSAAPTIQEGVYRKIGSQIFAYFHISISATLTSSSSNMQLSGLPFPAKSGGQVYGALSTMHMNNSFTLGNTEANFNGLVPPAASYVDMYFNQGASSLQLPVSRFGTGNILGCIMYFVA